MTRLRHQRGGRHQARLRDPNPADRFGGMGEGGSICAGRETGFADQAITRGIDGPIFRRGLVGASRPPRPLEVAVDGFHKSSSCRLIRWISSGLLSRARNPCGPSTTGIQGPHPGAVQVRVYAVALAITTISRRPVSGVAQATRTSGGTGWPAGEPSNTH
jgi:hypothetical protein